MKILQRFSTCLLLAVFLLPSCAKEFSLSSEQETLAPLVSDAQEFFETWITKGEESQRLHYGHLSPGKVTPRWDAVSCKRDDRYS
jgi:hypothetical protein